MNRYVHCTEAYYTHRPYLSRELSRLKDQAKILELGVGHGSSLLIHNYCKDNNCFATSFETNKQWFDDMKEQYQLMNYKFNLIESWSNFDEIFIDSFYDLVFVDQSPWEARIDSMDYLASKSNVIILHDYDYYQREVDSKIFENRYGDIFKIEYNDIELPPTLVLSKK